VNVGGTRRKNMSFKGGTKSENEEDRRGK